MGQAAGSVLMGVGGTVQAGGQAQAGKAAREAGELNAVITRFEAMYMIELNRRQTSELLGQQKAAYAAAGIRGTGGSPLLLEAETLRRAAREQTYIWQRGEMEAQIEEFTGEAAEFAGNMAALGTVLQTVGQMVNQGQGMKR